MLLRLFIVFNLLFLTLYACQNGYEACVSKVKDSHTIQNNSLLIPILKNKRLAYTQKILNYKILKYDPFLHLYLLEDKHPFSYPFEINMHLHLGTAAVNTVQEKEGKFLSSQIGLNHFAVYSAELPTAFIITSSCCSLEGVHTSKGTIQKAYLQHFINTGSSDYGDVGIRVHDERKFVIVEAIDPFFEGNPFQINDCIIAFDGKKVFNAENFMKQVLFAKINTKHRIKIKRSNKFYTYSIVVDKRYGGGYLSDTFLERKGFYFDENMHIVKLSKKFISTGIKNGDKLLQVNGVNIANQAELRKYLQTNKNYTTMLFERNNFQFFVKIK